MTGRSIGDVRPSQLITTFGPGAIVDLETLSVIVAGIDRWPVDETTAIHEPRLQRALHVDRFFSAQVSEGGFSKFGTVPALLFPRFQVCPVCSTLSAIGEGYAEYDAKWREIVCKAPGCAGRGKRRATTIPAPFIVACPGGHIDDFPWRDYAHHGATDCRKRMKLYSIARTGSVSDILIECECSKPRSASDAFGERRADALGPCSRRRPWLGIGNQESSPCAYSSDVQAMQRGATNAWFPVVRSALKVNEAATPIGIALSACNPQQLERIDTAEKLDTLIQLGMFPSLTQFPVKDVWTAILKERGEIQTDDIDLRWPEWLAFRNPAGAANERLEFFLERGAAPEAAVGLIEQVVLARKLVEVRALTGFTRVDSAGPATDGELQPKVARIYRNRPDWLPGVEVRGEGLFIELNEAAVSDWESRSGVQRRAKAMAVKFAAWQSERNTEPMPFPGARYVLLHSLGHILMRQLALDCGYSASSVRERVYSCSEPNRMMAGILLYTASPDSEGSLGGLVDLGSPQRFPDLLSGALRGAVRCSSDPLCADHQPDAHATINGAACHACLLASETSCEAFNRFLDRSFVVPTMAGKSLAFFESVLG